MNSRPRRCLTIATVMLVVMTSLLGFAGAAGADRQSDGASGHRADPPRAEIQQDGALLKVTWHRMAGSGATKLGYRLRGVDREFKIKGSTEQPQLKFVLADGETYRFSLRAYYPGKGWSRWTQPIRVIGGDTVARPWSVQVQAGDGHLTAQWSDAEADSYRYRVWSGRRLIRSGSTTDTEVVVDSLENGHTYRFTIQARYGRRFTTRTLPLEVTPNVGAEVSIALRNDETEAPIGREKRVVPTAITGATDRVDSLEVILAPTKRDRSSFPAGFDPAAQATPKVKGAWVTGPVPVEPLDYDVVAQARSADGSVLAGSIQRWILGTVDARAEGATAVTRIGTYR